MKRHRYTKTVFYFILIFYYLKVIQDYSLFLFVIAEESNYSVQLSVLSVP